MKITVFFFGGFNASQGDIDKWVKSAKLLKPSIEFIGYPWKSGPDSWPAETVVKGAEKSGQLPAAIDDVQGCDADLIYIVGHSSGCAVANAVYGGLEYTGHHVLVALDGYKPDDEQLDDERTQVWGADCQGKTSKNYPGPSKGRRRIYHATNCTELWSLHFSLVNEAASNGTVHGISTGYFNCKANLGFLSPK